MLTPISGFGGGGFFIGVGMPNSDESRDSMLRQKWIPTFVGMTTVVWQGLTPLKKNVCMP